MDEKEHPKSDQPQTPDSGNSSQAPEDQSRQAPPKAGAGDAKEAAGASGSASPQDKKPAEAARSGPPASKAGGSGEDSAGEKKAPVRPVRSRRAASRGPTYEDLEDDPLLNDLRSRFPEAEISGQVFLEQKIYTIPLPFFFDIMLFLRNDPEWQFDYLVDQTALDLLGEQKRFCLVYHFYSYSQGALIRVKCRVGEDEFVPSLTAIWKTADWMEREIYDMFGIGFTGHPDLKRILLPEDWIGYPLRKDYDIKLQDQAWIRNHLRIRKTPD